jgi:Calx-beta domain-containing protein
MTWFKRWLLSFFLAFSVGALTMSCQVLFGDFKVGDRAQGGAGGLDGSSARGGAGAQGGSGNVQPSGPIVVVPTSDLYTSDLGGQARFYVSLAQKPTTLVTVPIESSNEAEGTVSPRSLTFTRDDWNAPQAVTVTGVHDPRTGNQAYAVKVGPATSDDAAFRGAQAVIPITNIDNDGAGIFVTPTTLVTTEAGGAAVFTVVLNSAPAADVMIALSSSDDSAGMVSPSSLTFTRDNWSAPQIVTVTGVNDETKGGDRSYRVSVGPVTSSDRAYANLPAQTVNVTNQDNDRAGVMVSLGTGIDPTDTMRLRTSESGESATFTVALNYAPERDVTIEVASTSDEGTVTPSKLTFTKLNWAAVQTVTVIGADNDNVADGNQPYQIALGPVASEDQAYGSLTSADLPRVNVVNFDNDSANVAVTLLSGLDPNDASQLQTSEKGTSATFSLALTSKPKAAVQFGLTSTNAEEGTVSPARCDFTPSNWNVPQVVTVSGVDETVKDGNTVYAVRISAPTTDDANYQRLPSIDVKVKNLDDDVAGLTPPKLLSGVEGGAKLVTTEKGGSATFSLSLTSKPRDEVKLGVVSSNSAEGKVTPATLTFNAANYATAQVVTVTGLNDEIMDGNQAYTVTVGPSASNDSNYVGLSQSVKVTNNDDDSAYIVATPGYSGTTSETGTAASFGIHLNSQPTVAVTLSFLSSNDKEGKVLPASLMFTPANWSMSQTVMVTGGDDAVADGDQQYTIAVKAASTDANYQYAATTLTLVNKDDDVASLKITSAANLRTTEAGGKATFSVALGSQPTGAVNVSVSSSNIKEGTVSPASLAFTANNWGTAQTVTVTGVDDSLADGDQAYSVSLKTAASSGDPKYAQLAASSVSLVNTNDDQVGISVTPTSCATAPETTATFTVVLKSQPLGTVTISLSSDTPTEGTVSPETLSFTAANWNTPQTITVTGVDDGTMGMMTPYKIVTDAASSAMDASYNGLNPVDVACINSTPITEPPSP